MHNIFSPSKPNTYWNLFQWLELKCAKNYNSLVPRFLLLKFLWSDEEFNLQAKAMRFSCQMWANLGRNWISQI